MARAIDTFTIAAEECTRLNGSYLPLDISARNAGLSGITRRFPLGLVSMISPFNFPLNLVVSKIKAVVALSDDENLLRPIKSHQQLLRDVLSSSNHPTEPHWALSLSESLLRRLICLREHSQSFLAKLMLLGILSQMSGLTHFPSREANELVMSRLFLFAFRPSSLILLIQDGNCVVMRVVRRWYWS